MARNLGELLGLLTGYLLFTTILYLVLNLLNKFPSGFTYLHLAGITFLIAFFGSLINYLLK